MALSPSICLRHSLDLVNTVWKHWSDPSQKYCSRDTHPNTVSCLNRRPFSFLYNVKDASSLFFILCLSLSMILGTSHEHDQPSHLVIKPDLAHIPSGQQFSAVKDLQTVFLLTKRYSLITLNHLHRRIIHNWVRWPWTKVLSCWSVWIFRGRWGKRWEEKHRHQCAKLCALQVL